MRWCIARAWPEPSINPSVIAVAPIPSSRTRRRADPVIENTPSAVPFGFSAAQRVTGREAIPVDDFVFLSVGRFDRVKRVDQFIEACATLAGRVAGGLRFAIAGRDMDTDNAWLMDKLAASGVAERFLLMGYVTDRQRLYSAADCLIVTSESEGSPNVVYEAIATGLPSIVFGTLGTEHLSHSLVHRLPERHLPTLVDAMASAFSARARSAAARVDSAAASTGTSATHPLVSYYAGALGYE